MLKRRYGWRPSLPDQRDRLWQPPQAGPLPSSVDLRPHLPAVYDQGQLGSCVDNALAGLLQYDELRQGLESIMPARLFLYYGARQLEGSVAQDSGSTVADGLKSAARWGYCSETSWPYDVTLYTEQPPPACYQEALPRQIQDYAQVQQTAQQLKAALVARRPVIFGFTVYESFESQEVEKTGLVPLPHQSERTLGGHCMLIVGYDDAKAAYLARNSWGSTWGIQGYCWFPYAYIHSRLASDFWVINTLPGPAPVPPVPPVDEPNVMVLIGHSGHETGRFKLTRV